MRIAALPRRTVATVGAVAAVAVLLALAALAAGGGGEPPDRGPLAWDGPTRVVTVAQLPSDRVLTGRLRNTSPRAVRLVATDVRVLDDERRAIRSTARFAAAFGHALYSPRDAPREVAAREQQRLGEVVVVRPGESVPVTLAWRLEGRTGAPSVARIGTTSLVLPAGT